MVRFRVRGSVLSSGFASAFAVLGCSWRPSGSTFFVLASALRTRGDPTFSGATRVAQCFRGLKVFHQARNFLECRFRQLIQLEPYVFSDVSLIDEVEKVILRFHQR
jgi:hypothetical protein